MGSDRPIEELGVDDILLHNIHKKCASITWSPIFENSNLLAINTREDGNNLEIIGLDGETQYKTQINENIQINSLKWVRFN